MRTATGRFLSALTGRDCNPKRSSNGWSARCPAHEDRRPSLSVDEGDDGRVLVRCHAGCTVEEVCGELGLQVADLMPDDSSTGSTSTQIRESSGNGQNRRSRQSKVYETAKAAVVALERELGQRSIYWTYHDANGVPVGLIVRWDTPEGKVIRPVARQGDGWTIGGMDCPRPLYRLSDLAEVNRIYITEGEKSAEAARTIGLTATTSAHGSQGADKTDWTPLAGKECVILPDNDESGEKYAATVAGIIAKMTPASVVRVVELPDLPEKGDIADWVETQTDAKADELRRQVETLAEKAEVIQPERPAAQFERFNPFPTDALPDPIRRFVVAGAEAIGCDTSYLALPMLTVLAAAIGNTRRIQLKRGWTAPAIIWTAIVGESGTSKTPAFKLVMQFMHHFQRKALEAHAEATKQHEVLLAQYDKAISAWKRNKKDDGLPPEKPEPPEAMRYFVSDTTVEAMAPLLRANPRGLLLARDELAGWIGSFDRYSGGKGSADAAHWLSMHNGESMMVDRKAGDDRMIYVHRASVSVTGGIQPEILHRALGSEHRESGLAARLLLSCPPRKPKRWTEADIDPTVEDEVAKLLEGMYELRPALTEDGDLRPVIIGMTSGAKAEFKAYYNDHAKQQTSLSGDIAAAYSKLEEYAARLSLVHHYARFAAADPTLENANAVDATSMRAGIKLAQWFKVEAQRVYKLLVESGEDRGQRRLTEWIERRGGSTTVRELQQGLREYHTADKAEKALKALSKQGLGQWEPSPPGRRGRPTQRFVLSKVTTAYGNKAKLVENSDTVDAVSANNTETHPNEDWGEV